MVEVLIVFVGLTLWSEKVPNDCGVKAILPRVVHQHTATMDVVPHVQDHQAALVFPADSLVSHREWEPADLPTDPGFKFVLLDGEQVRFLTHGAANEPARLDGLKLPKLEEQLCPGKTLRAEFQAPYSGAAAVIALPQGAVHACLSVPAESQGRLDTQVKLQTDGTLVIAAITPNGTKELTLRPRQPSGRIELMVANLPASFFGEERIADNERAVLSHANAYYAMIGASGDADCPLKIRDWWDQLDPVGIPLCGTGMFPALRSTSMAGNATLPIDPSISTTGADFECSNNQWP